MGEGMRGDVNRRYSYASEKRTTDLESAGLNWYIYGLIIVKLAT